MVGGEKKLLHECGIQTTAEGEELSLFDESMKKTLSLKMTLTDLSKDLEVFENDIINSALERTR
jgi:hypothetical protein